MNQPLKAFNNVLEIQQRLKIASQLNAQVNFHIFIFSFTFFHFHFYLGIDGEWQEWGEWSHCDPSWSCGRKIRARACSTPLLGGNDCVGDPTETAPCSADTGCCSSTVSRIRTLESPYQPSCQNTTSKTSSLFMSIRITNTNNF